MQFLTKKQVIMIEFILNFVYGVISAAAILGAAIIVYFLGKLLWAVTFNFSGFHWHIQAILITLLLGGIFGVVLNIFGFKE